MPGMTTVIDRVRAWRADVEDGPDEWRKAWDRTIDLVAPLWGDKQMNFDGPMLAHGGAALAMAIYIVAREQNISPQQVTRAQVDELKPPVRDRIALWDRRLRALGHDPNDHNDPVMVWWRELVHDDAPPGGIMVEDWEFGANPGPMLGKGLDFALAPMWNLQF
jgi:hypothetical protein